MPTDRVPTSSSLVQKSAEVPRARGVVDAVGARPEPALPAVHPPPALREWWRRRLGLTLAFLRSGLTDDSHLPGKLQTLPPTANDWLTQDTTGWPLTSGLRSRPLRIGPPEPTGPASGDGQRRRRSLWLWALRGSSAWAWVRDVSELTVGREQPRWRAQHVQGRCAWGTLQSSEARPQERLPGAGRTRGALDTPAVSLTVGRGMTHTELS